MEDCDREALLGNGHDYTKGEFPIKDCPEAANELTPGKPIERPGEGDNNNDGEALHVSLHGCTADNDSIMSLNAATNSSGHLAVVIDNVPLTEDNHNKMQDLRLSTQTAMVEESKVSKQSKKRNRLSTGPIGNLRAKKRKTKEMTPPTNEIIEAYIEEHRMHSKAVEEEQAAIERRYSKETDKLQKLHDAAVRRKEKDHARVKAESTVEFQEIATRHLKMLL